MKEIVFGTKDDKQLIYMPYKCVGCGTCASACPKKVITIGSVGAVARGLINKNFLENDPSGCIMCSICAKVCPVGALEMRQAGKSINDNSFVNAALKPTTVDDKCVHCGLCQEVCPQECIEVKQWLSNDGFAKVDGETNIDNKCCVHCGWCASVCPVNAIYVEKPYAGTWTINEEKCTTCRTCVDTCPCNALFNPEWDVGERADKVKQRADACIYCGACDTACPIDAITVTKTEILVDVDKKTIIEKNTLNKELIRPTLTSVLVTDEEACLGCGNCVIVCPVNAEANENLASGYLNEVESKKLLEVRNGSIKIINQDVCGSDGACAMICPVDAIWLEKRE